MDLAQLFVPKATLLGAGPEELRLRACLGEAKAFLDATPCEALLSASVADASLRLAILDRVESFSHIGFLVPGEVSLERAAESAVAAGFDGGQATFASTILACELGARVDRDRVPTTVLTVSSTSPHRAEYYVELFKPDEEVPVVRRWIEEGVGTHFGLSVASLDRFVEALELLRSAGFRVPPFMNGAPMLNPEEQVTAIYLDTVVGGMALRLELAFHDER